MSYGATPVDGSSTPIPMSSVVPDGTINPVALAGGPSYSDSGNTKAPALMYIKDGSDLTQGGMNDAAVLGDVNGSISAKLRGLSKVFNSVWNNSLNFLNIGQADLTTGPTLINAAQPSASSPVSGATVSLTLGQGQSSWHAQVVAQAGFTSATTIVVDQSIDGGTTWFTANFKVSGSLSSTPVQSVNGPGPLLITGDAAAKATIRIRCSVLNSGESMNVFVRSGAGVGSVGLLSSVPAGSNLIGNISQAASQSTPGTLQNAYAGSPAAPYTGTNLTVLGMASVVFTVSGTFSATVTFRGSEDGVNWGNLDVEQLGGSAVGSTATGPGTFVASCASCQYVQAQVTAYTSGSVTVTAHATPVPFVSRRALTNIALWNGLVPGNSNPVITQDFIRGYIAAGQGFLYTSPQITVGTLGGAIVLCGLAMFNASTSGKNIVIYSLQAFCTTGSAVNGLRALTTDPHGTSGFTGTPAVQNLAFGNGTTTVASVSCTANNTTASITQPGTLKQPFMTLASQPIELLPNGAVIWLANGLAEGFAVDLTVTNSTDSVIVTAKGIEF